MISASTLNSELINKIAQDFAQATSLAVVVVNIHGDEISELFNFTPFCQLMRQHPEHSGRCRMSDRCGGLEASKNDQLCIYRCHAGLTDFSIPLVIAGHGTRVNAGAQAADELVDRVRTLLPDVRVAALTRQMEHLGASIAGEAIARASRPITREVNQAGESALGSLVADSYRQAMAADFAFLHLDGLRADLPPGDLTRGDQFAVQPHNLNLVRLELTGAQVRDLLEQQWQGADDEGRRLQVSGLTYTWDASRPAGQRIVTVRAQGQILRPEARYTVAVNEHLAGGGEQLSVLTHGVNPVVGPFVAEALAGYLASCPQPIEAGIQGRISRLN